MLDGDRPDARRGAVLRPRRRGRDRADARARRDEGRADDTPEVIARRLAIYHEQTEPVVERYRATGQARRAPRRRADRRGLPPRSPAALELLGRGGRGVIIRKGAAEIERIARAGDRRRRDDRPRRRAPRAGHHDRRARRHRRGSSSASTAASRRRRGYKGYPARDLHLRRTTSSSTGSRTHSSSRRRSRHDRRRRHARRRDRRQRLHLRRRRDRRRGAAASRRRAGRARGRHRARPASATGSATSRTRSRASSRAPGFSVVRSLVGHGVGRYYHEDPHVPNFGAAGARPAALGGHDDRDRADDHGRRPRRVARTRTAGRSRPRTARCPPTSSTPWRSLPRRAADPHAACRASPPSGRVSLRATAPRSSVGVVAARCTSCYTAQPARQPVGCARYLSMNIATGRA